MNPNWVAMQAILVWALLGLILPLPAALWAFIALVVTGASMVKSRD